MSPALLLINILFVRIRLVPCLFVCNIVFITHGRKLCVVFDCPTFKGTFLNQHLLQDPNLISTLLGSLCIFKLETVAVTRDIQAMFHQVKVEGEDRDFLPSFGKHDKGKQNFYLEDCLNGMGSQKGGFTLTKWISSSCSVLQTIPEKQVWPWQRNFRWREPLDCSDVLRPDSSSRWTSSSSLTPDVDCCKYPVLCMILFFISCTSCAAC